MTQPRWKSDSVPAMPGCAGTSRRAAICLCRSSPYPRIDYVFSSDPHPRNLRVSSSRPLPWDIQTHPPTKKPRPRKFLQHSPCGRVGLLTSLRWDIQTHPPTKKPRPKKFLQHSPCGRVGLLTSLRWDIQTHPPTKKPRPRKSLQHSPCGRAGLLTSLRSSPSRASRALAFAPLRGALCEPTRHRTKPCGFVRVAEAVGRRSRQARPALREGGGNR